MGGSLGGTARLCRQNLGVRLSLAEAGINPPPPLDHARHVPIPSEIRDVNFIALSPLAARPLPSCKNG